MLVDEAPHVVHEAVYNDELLALGELLLDLLHGVLGEGVGLRTPVQKLATADDLLLEHLELALLDGLLVEAHEMVGAAHVRESPDEPLGGVERVVLGAVAVVVGELVVEVVVALAEGDEAHQPRVPRGALVRVGERTKVVGNAVHAERGVVNQHARQHA